MKSAFTLVTRSQVRGAAILFSWAQFVLFVLVSAYLLSRGAELWRRRRRSWDAITERLGLSRRAGHSDAAELDSRFSNKAIEEDAAHAEGRQRMFHEAGAMMEMADYAERNGTQDVAPVVARLRAHAMAIRARTALNAVGFGGRRDPGSQNRHD